MESSRLVFRKMKSSDKANYFKLAKDKKVMRYITGKGLSEQEAEERFEKVLEENSMHTETGFFSALNKKNNNFLGLIKFVYLSDTEVEIGYSLLPENWGIGYATEMVEFMISYGQMINKVRTLIAYVAPENLRSQKLLGKFGFQLYKEGLVNNLPTMYFKLELDTQNF